MLTMNLTTTINRTIIGTNGKGDANGIIGTNGKDDANGIIFTNGKDDANGIIFTNGRFSDSFETSRARNPFAALPQGFRHHI